MASEFSRAITAPEFEAEVLERSKTTPVLLDFWASWCGPCRALSPTLEALADEYAGAFMLGKVDTEAEQDLAYAFGVQGIPFCVLMDGGKAVDAFSGALPETEVRRFLSKNGITPKAVEQPQPAAQVDPASPAARWQAALAAARVGDVAAAQVALTNFPEEEERFADASRVLAALPWLAAAPGASQANGVAEQGLIAAARALRGGDLGAAMEQLLQSVAADRGYREGLARKALLLCFLLGGDDSEQVDAARRRLALLLY